ncbi:hypothetical protein BDP67DRAFT_493639 [Colletotrichum lupini]|nr:hypothetical protein BDP67DRAFT_493639 [Colletotrichum lupini]
MPCTMETSEPRAPGKRGEQGRALALRLLCFCCAAAARGTHVPIPLGRRAPYSVRLRLVKYTTLRSLRTHRLGSHPFAYKKHRGWQWISLHSVNGYLSDTTCAYRSGSKRSPTTAHHHPFSLRVLTAPDSPICRGTTAPRPWSQP